MTIFERHPVTSLNEFVFGDQETEVLIRNLLKPNCMSNALFYGPPGTGKSTICKIIANEIVGKGFGYDILTVNASLDSTAKKICDAIIAHNQTICLGPSGKRVIVLEELDGAEQKAQRALKAAIEQASDVVFLASTNDIRGVDAAIRDRFLEVPLREADPFAWMRRASDVLFREGIDLDRSAVRKLLELRANRVSGRQVMRTLNSIVEQVRAKNE